MKNNLERRIVFEAKIEGDTVEEIVKELFHLIGRIRKDEGVEKPISLVSGGCNSNHTVTMRVNPEVTPESYRESLNLYLEAKRVAMGVLIFFAILFTAGCCKPHEEIVEPVPVSVFLSYRTSDVDTVEAVVLVADWITQEIEWKFCKALRVGEYVNNTLVWDIEGFLIPTMAVTVFNQGNQLETRQLYKEWHKVSKDVVLDYHLRPK